MRVYSRFEKPFLLVRTGLLSFFVVARFVSLISTRNPVSTYANNTDDSEASKSSKQGRSLGALERHKHWEKKSPA